MNIPKKKTPVTAPVLCVDEFGPLKAWCCRRVAIANLARTGQCVAVPELNHLALAVRDPIRSLRFYREIIAVEGAVREEVYGFVITTPRGLIFTLFSGQPPVGHGEFHFGVSLPDGDAVRTRRKELLSSGVAEIEWCDEPGYVSLKVSDPDGYTVEIACDDEYPSR